MVRETLSGMTAIVTGASAGVGRETAKALAAEGASVVLVARRANRLEEIAEDIEERGGTAVPFSADVSEEEAVEDLIETTVDEFGSLEILVNNAGIGRGDSVQDLTTEEYRAMMAVNVDGFFFTTRAALPHLIESTGNLIYIGSFAGQYPRSFNPVYAASKWWARGFAKSMMAEAGDEDVAVSLVNPSEIRTEFGGQDGTPFKEQFDEGEVLEPEQVADAVVFAAKQESATVSEMDLYRRDKFDIF
ncbi:MAG: SDR family oxidoreductase [Halodesulfurarchaeum sp.]